MFCRRISILSGQHNVFYSCVRPLACNVQVTMTPMVSLVDEKLKTVVSGLCPRQKVSLKLSVTNHANLNYASINHYTASDKGIVDLDTSAPVSGPWQYADPMLIFWTMKPQQNSDKRFWSVNVENGLDCTLQVYNGHLHQEDNKDENLLAAVSGIQRKYLGEGVKRIPIKHGRLRGTLFLPPGEGPFRSVIKVYGGIHRGQVIEDKAAMFASRGFASLSLAFFGVDDLPKTYASQPLELEYFEEAVDFMLSLKEVDASKGVGVCGISKAGEIALLMASFLAPKVSAIAVMNSIVNCGLVPATYKGKIVVPAYNFHVDENTIKTVGQNLFDITAIMNNYRDQKETIIPFAKSKAPILLIAGEHDMCFNAAQQVDYAEELMIAAGKKNFKVLKYPGLGHLIDLPFAPPTIVTNHALFPKPALVLMGGDDLKRHEDAQENVWSELINFFKEN